MNHSTGASLPFYPIPPEAITTPHWIEGGEPGSVDVRSSSDRHLLIVADNGSDLYVSSTYDTRWDNGVLNPAFHSITADDFEVVQLGYKPAAIAPPTNLRIISTQ